VDLRLVKAFRLSSTGRVKGMFDIYNLFNANTVLLRNNTYGSTWGRPTAVLGARLFKFGVQVEF
jgi:hypothetical protein